MLVLLTVGDKIKKMISNDIMFVPVFVNICHVVYEELEARHIK